MLKLIYDYGTTQNNGNVLSQIITVPTVGTNTGFAAVQTYSYDSLNRLKDAAEMLTPNGGSATQTWTQTFVYDRYGNRTFDTTLNRTTTIPTGCPVAVCNPSADATNNKLVGYQFDAAGNTKQDAESRKFTYDAENKQVKVETVDASGNPISTIGEYFYDGGGKRVKKHVPSTGETTIFVYDAAGKLVAEYSTIVEPTATAKVSYLTNDHLGSPRINTDRNGNVTARHDYHPFGEEIATGQRSAGLGYANDTVRKQFTGYERDKETELDFAQARMYMNRIGRFASTDPIYLKEDRLADPQQLNLFAYVRNNPLKLTDPTGLDFEFRGKDKDKFVQDANKRDKAAFQIQLNEDGIVAIVDEDKVDVDELNDTEKALYDAIKDTNNRAVLIGIDENPYIDFGGSSSHVGLTSNPGLGLNIIDASDMALLRAASPTAAGEIMGHEMMEAYAQAKTGSLDYDDLHDAASESFPKPEINRNLASSPAERNSPTISGGTTTWTLTRPKKDISFAITYKFVTPVPRASVSIP